MASTMGLRTVETPANIRQVILSSSVGTIIEWYDFYIFGSLATIIGPVLFGTTARLEDTLLGALAVFGAGFAARPFGAIFFGRLGDLIGRKYAFLATLVLMGLATFITGLVPTYDQIGIAATLIVVILRVLQGLALGGEYGGAATYIAEHVPDNKRGYYTSWIQTTATVGFFMALAVIFVTRTAIGEDAFRAWGWRIPFLISIVLVGLSFYLRLRLRESPIYTALQNQGKSSVNPLKDAFASGANWRVILTVLFGAAAGQAVVWYTGQFYAFSWLQTIGGLSYVQAVTVLLWAIALATPFFIFFGSLSDRIGRKPIMMLGNLVAAVLFIPIFTAMKTAAGPTEQFVTQKALDATRTEITSVLSSSNSALVDAGIKMQGYLEKAVDSTTLAAGGKVGTFYIPAADNKALRADIAALKKSADPEVVKFGGTMEKNFKRTLTALKPNILQLIFWVWLLIIFVTMVYGPIAAFLVESFPAKIRYSSVSLPYHVGNGYFGGFTPYIATALVASSGNIYAGLYWPIGVALLTFVVGMFLVRESHKNSIHSEVN
jgi:MFS family permease